MAKLRQVGNSLVVTIPAGLAKRYGLRAGDDVEIEADGDTLRIVPMLRVPRRQIDPETDQEAGARALLRRYHAELSEALERAERAGPPDGCGDGRHGAVERAGAGVPTETSAHVRYLD